jgi:hypothetical protein
MPLSRRFLPLLTFASLACITFLFHSLRASESWRSFPLEKIGLGEEAIGDTPPDSSSEAAYKDRIGNAGNAFGDDTPGKPYTSPLNNFQPGTTKPVGSNYTKMLVIPRMRDEDVEWLDESFADMLESGLLKTAIYVADDPKAPLHPPKNKGHEVMIYLSYIIDHYDDLADVNIFMHAHRWSWHNNDLLDNDAAQMIGRLSAERVQREGYMNMRCHWNPGCPDWMHPGTVKEDINKQEETMLAKSWSELFPLDPIPNVLAQPCCAQFAISRDRLRAIPLARFVFYRDWLLRTPLSDYISGRIWEYIWQFIFTGQNVFCPTEHICYCDGFGVCFGNEDNYNEWFELLWTKRGYEEELRIWHEQDTAIRLAQDEGRLDEAKSLEVPQWGRNRELEDLIDELSLQLNRGKLAAMARGDVAQNRAIEAGRPWKDGDGF